MKIDQTPTWLRSRRDSYLKDAERSSWLYKLRQEVEHERFLREQAEAMCAHVQDQREDLRSGLAAAMELMTTIDAHYSGSLDHQPAYVRLVRAALEGDLALAGKGAQDATELAKLRTELAKLRSERDRLTRERDQWKASAHAAYGHEPPFE